MNFARASSLLQTDQQVFHTRDLALLWGIESDQTLYTTISRLVKRGVLSTIHKGLYSVVRPEELDRYLLGLKLLHRYGYVSCETVLSQAGIISQQAQGITFVSDVSRKLTVDNNHYYVRKLADKFLYVSEGISERADGVRIAWVERAVADMLYFNPQYYFDGVSLINWDRVNEIQQKVGYT